MDWDKSKGGRDRTDAVVIILVALAAVAKLIWINKSSYVC
jgi:hypothetical protein